MVLLNCLDLCGTWQRIEKMPFSVKGWQIPKTSKNLLICIYIYKVNNQYLELRQDGWLKEKMNGAIKLPALMWYQA